MRRLLLILVAFACAACAAQSPPPPRAPQASRAATPSLELPQSGDSQAVASRLAAADGKLASVRDARSWPSVEDRERWVRDVRVADTARAQYEEARGSAAEVAALDRYEGAVAIAFASRRAIELGDMARRRP